MSIDDARALLASLRWRADMAIVNHFGESVWLKADLDDAGVQRGITECCLTEAPCAHHASAAS